MGFLSKYFDFTGGAQYSLRGSNTSGSYPKFRNQYVDVFLNPKIKFFNIFRIGVGGQYSYLLSSNEKKLSVNQTFGEKYQKIKEFHSQVEAFVNAELMLTKCIFFQAKYSLPFNNEYSNLQFYLNQLNNSKYDGAFVDQVPRLAHLKIEFLDDEVVRGLFLIFVSYHQKIL